MILIFFLSKKLIYVFKQFMAKPKLGGDDAARPFQQKLESESEEKFQMFKSENNRKRQEFIVSF